jgi:hypothetical protein
LLHLPTSKWHPVWVPCFFFASGLERGGQSAAAKTCGRKSQGETLEFGRRTALFCWLAMICPTLWLRIFSLII